MFDLDIGKAFLVAVVALVVVGPKELPHVLRALAQGVGRLRSLQFSAKKLAAEFIAEADLDGISKEFASREMDLRRSIALNPSTVMRGTLPNQAGATIVTSTSNVEAPHYASAEMKAYLLPVPESLPDNDLRVGILNSIPVQVNDVTVPGSVH